MTTKEILAALRQRHDARDWCYLEELRLGTGYGGKWERRIDAWAICYYPSRGLHRIAYEVKASRADWLAELRNPEKHQAALEISNLFYFVMPEGITKEDEVPEGCGLIIATENKTQVVIEATYRDCPAPPWRFVASVCRRIKAMEEAFYNKQHEGKAAE
jgi:hypothetical protein